MRFQRNHCRPWTVTRLWNGSFGLPVEPISENLWEKDAGYIMDEVNGFQS